MKTSAVVGLRLALIALLFQVVCPLFISVISLSEDHTSRGNTTLHASDHSVEAPQLLKEKEEGETEETEHVAELIPLIDFSNLPLSLSRYHRNKITPFYSFLRFDQHPPLFTLNSVFII
jgi:hypothetical protein